MSKRKLIYSVLGILFTITLILSGIIFHFKNQPLTVNFLDIGQGDAILISEGSKQILIDGGPDGQTLMEKLGKYVPFWDRQIEVVIVTHPDQDHMEGIVEVLENYQVEKIIDNGQETDSEVYKKYKELIGNNDVERLSGTFGYKIKLSEVAQMDILSPFGQKENTKDSNDQSVVSRLTIGENSFLFTGDISQEIESVLAKANFEGKNLLMSTKVLKIAHHGSKYSTSDSFLAVVKPEEAVISVGKQNRYGHPAPETIEKLEKEKIEILRTDQRGDVIYECRPNNECILSY